MIPNQWYVILESKEVKHGKPIGFTRFGEKLVAWRDAHGKISVMRDRCPHRGVALSVGDIRGDCIECPFHGFQFDTSGRCTLIPANGRNAEPPEAMQVHTLPTHEAHELIYAWYGEPQNEYPALPFFDAIDESFSHRTVTDRWKAHYSRVIENQLDVVHVPFIHRTTIGRGHKTLVNGPLSRLESCPGESDLLNIWVSNEVDTGQTPKRASELPEPTRHPSLQFRFPNLWHNWISDQMHIIIAFAPIDDANTLLYLRSYQHIATAPILRPAFDLVGAVANLVVERQDKRVVITQEPKRADLNIGETLIQGDAPIITYRRHRRELIEQTECTT
ncbi:MAG TPA: aromatic ring-hydroxylating dioxygenase subunit alpha [Anaerolineae bacterium]|nr:aromatic ring-hydroxylating dioxygenase subunit alpha [Anaerolineae bacterium]